MYVVIGANGFLGSYVIKNILEHTSDKILATTRDLNRIHHQIESQLESRLQWEYCSLENEDSVKRLSLLVSKKEVIKLIYLAAYHHPDEVSQNPLLAWNINVTCLSKFLENISRAGGWVQSFTYASTDSVYGESKDGYIFEEIDKLNPVNFYGHCKCAAEALVVNFGYNVVRFPFLISPSLVYKKHFYDQIVEDLKSGKNVEMYADSYRSSLSFDNAAFLLIKLLEKKCSFEFLNICGDEALSKYDVGLLIAKREHLNPEKIIPISMEKVSNNFVTKRATSTLMSNGKLKSLLHLKKINIFEQPQFLA